MMELSIKNKGFGNKIMISTECRGCGRMFNFSVTNLKDVNLYCTNCEIDKTIELRDKIINSLLVDKKWYEFWKRK
jgi:hypothetical protein